MKVIKLYYLLMSLLLLSGCSNDEIGNDIMGFKHYLIIKHQNSNILNETFPIQEHPIALDATDFTLEILVDNLKIPKSQSFINNISSNNYLELNSIIRSSNKQVTFIMKSSKIFGDSKSHVLDIVFKMENNKHSRQNGLIQYDHILFDEKPSLIIGHTDLDFQISEVNID